MHRGGRVAGTRGGRNDAKRRDRTQTEELLGSAFLHLIIQICSSSGVALAAEKVV